MSTEPGAGKGGKGETGEKRRDEPSERTESMEPGDGLDERNRVGGRGAGRLTVSFRALGSRPRELFHPFCDGSGAV